MLEQKLPVHAKGFHHANRVPRELLVYKESYQLVGRKPKNTQKIVRGGKDRNKEISLNIFSTNAASLKVKLKKLK